MTALFATYFLNCPVNISCESYHQFFTVNTSTKFFFSFFPGKERLVFFVEQDQFRHTCHRLWELRFFRTKQTQSGVGLLLEREKRRGEYLLNFKKNLNTEVAFVTHLETKTV